MQAQHLEVAIRFLRQDIQASLTLGDLSLLEHEVDWLAGLLVSYDIPIDYLPKYLTQYNRAVDENLEERGQPVKDWFEVMVNE